MFFKIEYAANKTGHKQSEQVECLTRVEAERIAFNLAISEYRKRARTTSDTILKSGKKAKNRDDAEFEADEHILNTIWYDVTLIEDED
jgi:DNA/RNA endonuclease G (NUC1)